MIRFNEILDKISGYMTPEQQMLVQKAYIFSATAHEGQTRRSGEPYMSHPLEVANLTAELRMDPPTIAAGLLHDTVEDTKVSIEELDSQFGEETADIVDGVTKISQIVFDSKEEAQAENIRKMIMAMSEDIRVLIVKLADRLHNMRTLEFMPEPKQRLIAMETSDIYAPLANRLGLHRIKIELEDLSLFYLKPDVYAHLLEGVGKHQQTGKEYIEKVIELIESMLKKNKIKGRVRGRTKHLYSIYRKMEQQKLTLDQVHDIIAFRVIVNSVKNCYAVLGLVHAAWRPVPGRFKDYISMPKANMYQSLHTTVIGPDGERIEIQIRTEEMHQLAEYGVAAHWLYKEGGKGKPKDIGQFAWLRQIMDWQKEESDSREFMRSLRFDLFKDEVYVFTPKGDVKEMPDGATPVDFAYMIHTEVGSRCAGAKVNGRLVPLNTKLVNGDTVEIITNPNRRPSRDWLKFVKTAKARTRISHYIRTEERARAISLGKEMLEKQGRRMSINVAKALKEGEFDKVVEDFSFNTIDDLLSAVGYARVTPRKVLHRLLPKTAKEPKEEEEHIPTPEERSGEAAAKRKNTDGVSIKGVDDVLVRFAKCCNPVPGDAIIGYISRGRGVTVHTTDCPNTAGMEQERLIQVSWDGVDEHIYPAKIRILSKNEHGVLAKISALLAKAQVNIDSGTIHSTIDGNTEMNFTIEVKDTSHLYAAIEQLGELDMILEVTRISSP